MWNTTVCFTDPLHNMKRTSTDLGCFTGCYWTFMYLTPGLFPVTFIIVRLHSILPFNSLTHTFLRLCTYLLYVNFVITCFSCWKFFPFMVTFRHPFLDVQVFVGKWGPLALFFLHKKGGGAVVSVDVLDLPTLSSSVGPLGPEPEEQTHNLPALSAVLTGPPTLDGVEQVPPPPVEPYENFLRRAGRLSTASSSSAPQPAAVDVTRNLVTLPSALPRPFPTFEGLEQHPRAPVPAPGLGKLLPDNYYIPPPDPWKWPGPGPVVPTFPSHLVVPGMPPVHARAPWAFPAAVARPHGPLPVLMTPGPSTKNTIPPPRA